MTARRSKWMQDHLDRMREPETVKKLRNQLERLENKRSQRVRDYLADREAKRLREEIQKYGEEPCA